MRKLMKDKKGAEMTIGTIVIIVLALIVLVVLIVGFTGGWGNLWGRISAFFTGSNNVDSIVSACNVACSTNAKYDYCERTREIKYGEGETATVTCESLEAGKKHAGKIGSAKVECQEITCDKTKCDGTATACTGLDETKCSTQQGCEWK